MSFRKLRDRPLDVEGHKGLIEIEPLEPYFKPVENIVDGREIHHNFFAIKKGWEVIVTYEIEVESELTGEVKLPLLGYLINRFEVQPEVKLYYITVSAVKSRINIEEWDTSMDCLGEITWPYFPGKSRKKYKPINLYRVESNVILHGNFIEGQKYKIHMSFLNILYKSPENNESALVVSTY